MKIVVDTNIVFSAILNTDGNIADLLTSGKPFDFYAPHFILTELAKHQQKLLKILQLDAIEQLDELRFLVTQNIKFISEFQISNKDWKVADELTKDVDSDDMIFVALTSYLEATLWTGDKKLRTGLKNKGYEPVMNTQELLILKQT